MGGLSKEEKKEFKKLRTKKRGEEKLSKVEKKRFRTLRDKRRAAAAKKAKTVAKKETNDEDADDAKDAQEKHTPGHHAAVKKVAGNAKRKFDASGDSVEVSEKKQNTQEKETATSSDKEWGGYCKACHQQFVFTTTEREFYIQKGWTTKPSKCKTCLATKRAANKRARLERKNATRTQRNRKGDGRSRACHAFGMGEGCKWGDECRFDHV